ncbi:MAG TPA: ABC transporter permease [Candidatus Sulfomarinibacteraceae bacterium]|nr:ABC transporter permease [Candidatus Sulfomarinibacteraceae bacterium]
MSEVEKVGRPPPGAEVDSTGFSDVAEAVDSTLTAGRGREQLAQYLPALLVFAGGILLWELFVRAFDVQQFLLPAPSVIGAAFRDNFDRLVHIGWFTTKEALGGFAIGCSLGIIVALATARWSAASETLMPFAIAANSVPIIAFAPILNNWFGIDNPLSKMAIVAIIVFFPMMINTVRGLTLVEPAALELMRSYAANEFEILFKLRLPNALPYMFNAFKVAAALSMIGAVVSEYFGGNHSALGVFITQEAAQFRFARAWAAIIIASIVGVSFYLVILTIERLVIPWHASVRQSER